VLSELPLVEDGDRVGDFHWFGEPCVGGLAVEGASGDLAVLVGADEDGGDCDGLMAVQRWGAE
jgi:hypothetical protein